MTEKKPSRAALKPEAQQPAAVTAREVIDALVSRLPAQVTTLTHDSGAVIPVRIMEGDPAPMAGRIAGQLLWLLSERYPSTVDGVGVWYEGDLRVLALEVEAVTDGH